MGDILCGVLTSMAFGLSIPPMFTSTMDRPRHLCQFYMVMRVDACKSQSDFKLRLQQMTNEVRDEPSKHGEKVLLAIDPQIEKTQRRQKEGISEAVLRVRCRNGHMNLKPIKSINS